MVSFVSTRHIGYAYCALATHIAKQHFNKCPQEDTTKHGVRKMVPEAMYNSNMVLGVCQEQHRGPDGKHGEKRCTGTAAHKCINRLKPA